MQWATPLTKQTPQMFSLTKPGICYIIHAINAALLLILTSFQRDCPAVAIAAAAAAATIGDAL
jgi:hypothetical protein